MLLAPALAGASCTSLRLREYRDDALVEEYRYTLGEKYIEVEGLNVCYQEMGEGETVLILPGLATSIDYWQKNIPALAEEHHVLAYERPGIGKSDIPDIDYNIFWVEDQVLAFMDAKGVERASIIGSSLGGHVAILIALDHPERVSKLVLMGTVGAWPDPDLIQHLGLQLLWWDFMVADVLRWRWPRIYSHMVKHNRPFAEEIYRYELALRADWKRYYPQGRAASQTLKSLMYASCRERLGEVTCPALLVWGEEDEIHSPRGTAVYFREHLPDSRLVVVPDAAHEVMVDQPEVFNQVVLDFLHRVGV